MSGYSGRALGFLTATTGTVLFMFPNFESKMTPLPSRVTSEGLQK